MPLRKYGRKKVIKPRTKRVVAVYRKKRTVKGPKIDSVVTRNFKFVGKTTMTSSLHDCIAGNFKNTFQSIRIIFDAQLIPGLLLWSKVYQEFRIDKITAEWHPCATMGYFDDQGGDVANTAKTVPRFFMKVIKGTEKIADRYWTTESAALMDGCKSYLMTKPMKVSWIPTQIQLGSAQGGLVSGGTLASNVQFAVKQQWNSFQTIAVNPNIFFYGLQIGVGATTADTNEFLSKLIVKIKCSFRNPTDDLDNIAASVATVYVD